MIQISNDDFNEKNQIQNLDINISTIGNKLIDKNKKDETKIKELKTNIGKFEIVKNIFFAFFPDNTNKYKTQNSFLEIAIFTNVLINEEPHLNYHLYKNELNEIYIFKYNKEKNKEEVNDSNKEEEEEENNINDKNDKIKNIFEFSCFDNNCNGIGSLTIDLSKSLNNSYNYLFNIIKEHSLPYQEHSYIQNLEGNFHIYLDILKNNPHINNIQLINVPNNFNDNTCIPLNKDNILNLSSINLNICRENKNGNYLEKKNLNEYQEGNYELINDRYYLSNRKMYKGDKLLSLNIKRQRKPYNVIKQKDYTFVKSKLETLVYAEEKYSRGKDARLENSTSRQNWFSYIHKKFGSRTRLGPHFHRNKKDNKIYKYVIKHLLTGFEDKTLSFYCPLNKCSGKGIMNLENEIFIEVKKHDMSFENHFFRGHQIIDDYYSNHPEITDIQVLRTQNKKEDKEIKIQNN